MVEESADRVDHLTSRESHGCLFHWKLAIIRHFSTVLSTYATDAVLRSDLRLLSCADFGLAFVPIADIIMIYDAHNQAAYKL